ncbi:DNA replication and repair protein RecF [Candidatus Gracilibacteria bacterium]|nr:DNA replication and repair protein RecF [Candidatus Gracilibacteria bacterium]
MILEAIRLRYFRNFEDYILHLNSGKNIIIGNNGAGKTNILEALALPMSHLLEGNPLYHVQRGYNITSLQYTFNTSQLIYSYDSQVSKKKYILEQKGVSKQTFQNNYPHIISFHPHMMNLLYGSPSARREFLDDLLIQAFPEYQKKLTQYKKIITSRNKVLARISEGKSDLGELTFWDSEYIICCGEIYKYRDLIIDFLSNHIHYMKEYFFGKVEKIGFTLVSKTPKYNKEKYLTEYIKENQRKEILQRKTLRGPHLDDFEIHIDHTPLVHYASRGEVKSILLGLKFLGGDFIIQHSSKQDILFLIDDILSELDDSHIKCIYSYIGGRQCIITSIHDIDVEAHKIYI